MLPYRLICALVALVIVALAPATAPAKAGRAPWKPKHYNRVERSALKQINAYRAQNGLQPLRIDRRLTRAAEWTANDLAGRRRFTHIDSRGRDVDERLQAFGYPGDLWWGENLAASNRTAGATVRQWKQSPFHDAALLDAEYNAAGLARVRGGRYGWYWALEFGGEVVTPA